MKRVFKFKTEAGAEKFKKDVIEFGGKVVANGDYDCPCVEVEESRPALTRDDMYSAIESVMGYYEEELYYTRRQMYRIEEEMYTMFYNHEQGHLPKIKDAGKMQEALNALGLGESFEVAKPYVMVASNKGLEVSISSVK